MYVHPPDGIGQLAQEKHSDRDGWPPDAGIGADRRTGSCALVVRSERESLTDRSRPGRHPALGLTRKERTMGLAWQQGPVAPGAIGRFLVPDPLPERLLYAEPLRRRMRVRFGEVWVADSEDVTLLHEPGRYPVAYFPAGDIADGVLEPSEH